MNEQHATNIGKIVLALREHVAAGGPGSLPWVEPMGWALPLLNGNHYLAKMAEAGGRLLMALAELSEENAAEIVSSMRVRGTAEEEAKEKARLYEGFQREESARLKRQAEQDVPCVHKGVLSPLRLLQQRDPILRGASNCWVILYSAPTMSEWEMYILLPNGNAVVCHVPMEDLQSRFKPDLAADDHAGPAGPMAETDETPTIRGRGDIPARSIQSELPAMNANCRTTEPKLIEFPPWQLHELRRTASIGMANIKIAPRIVDACPNHISGANPSLADMFNNVVYADEKRQALDACARYPASINVVPRQARGACHLVSKRNGRAERLKWLDAVDPGLVQIWITELKHHATEEQVRWGPRSANHMSWLEMAAFLKDVMDSVKPGKSGHPKRDPEEQNRLEWAVYEQEVRLRKLHPGMSDRGIHSRAVRAVAASEEEAGRKKGYHAVRKAVPARRSRIVRRFMQS